MAGTGCVTPTIVRRVLQTTAASREQRDFFEAFLVLVYEPVEAEADSDGEALLLVSCDRSRLELQVTSETALMRSLAGDFLRQCGIPDLSGADRFNAAARESKTPQASLWCRLKRIGLRSPVADIGFAVEREAGSMLGAMGGLAVPRSKDSEALQKHASDSRMEPCLYGTSILPDRRGRAPTILEYNMSLGTSAKLLLSGLGFFRMLNFTKPDDAMLRLLKSCGADTCTVRAFLTADGLTQLSLRLRSSSALIVNDAALQFYAMLGGDPVLVELAMDSQGSSMAFGYTSILEAGAAVRPV